jgi:hypothetical protein
MPNRRVKAMAYNRENRVMKKLYDIAFLTGLAAKISIGLPIMLVMFAGQYIQQQTHRSKKHPKQPAKTAP